MTTPTTTPHHAATSHGGNAPLSASLTVPIPVSAGSCDGPVDRPGGADLGPGTAHDRGAWSVRVRRWAATVGVAAVFVAVAAPLVFWAEYELLAVLVAGVGR